jgi:Dolichyl-phosphate-mannose-protein mannosyltransferase
MHNWLGQDSRAAATMHVLALCGILALAGGLRLWNIHVIGLRGDEAVYAGQAAVLAGDIGLKPYFVLLSRGNSNFLIYQGILALFYTLFGVNDALARVVSAGFSVATIAITYELGRTLFSKQLGLLAALLLSVSSYVLALGQLALLDTTLTFFFASALLCAAKWMRSSQNIWLYACAASVALAMQTKVVGVLPVPIIALCPLIVWAYPTLNRRTLTSAVVVFALFLTPALAQIIQNQAIIVQFLSQSIRRVSTVSWDYYLTLIIGYEGYVLPLIWLAGLLVALWRRAPGDKLALLWLLIVAAFHQLYPLKAFNYLLPLTPALALLGARAISALVATPLGRALPALVLAAVLGSSIGPIRSVMRGSDFAGLREAGQWLQANTPSDTGAMIMSRGSAQFALSFYAQRPAYPFGRFWLSTVLPGGTILHPRPPAEGTPTDWVRYWPARLIQNGTVRYLVYHTNNGDDPPEEPLVQTSTERKFRELIEAYGGRLVHTVYYNHEGRVWIYEVRELQPQPRLTFSTNGRQIEIEGLGFRRNSHVTLYYNRTQIATQPTDDIGAFAVTLPLMQSIQPRYQLVAVDAAGNDAALTGEHIWGAVHQATGGT